jgi:peptide-methionine (S)-S-oxide reductase
MTSSSPTAILDQATLGGGCFWCLEAVFEQLRGVVKVESGYAGGHVPQPTYEQVCSGDTGHAEVVRVTFDPTIISYRDLLGVFFATHDPTTLNRQGNDSGTQYRSVIFYHTEQQKQTAQQLIEELNAAHLWDRPIVTELSLAPVFTKAEGYHQEYYRNNPSKGYCQAVVAPKVAKFRKQFAALLNT